MTKKQRANKLGYEYLGKGFDDSGNDGFIVRKHGTTNYINIGANLEQVEEWLLRQEEYKKEDI